MKFMPCPSLGPKRFWSVQFVLDGSNLFWLVQTILDGSEVFWTCFLCLFWTGQKCFDQSKMVWIDQNELNQSKTNWTDQNRFGPIEGQGINFMSTHYNNLMVQTDL